jgi:hypothetical protein
MAQYPLLFSFENTVLGKGFVAHVTTHGRALASEEEKGVWIYGVEPGGVSAGGATFPEARAEFGRAFSNILFDIALDAADFQDFEAQADTFFAETDVPTLEEWDAALKEMRAGRLVEALEKDPLPTLPANSPRCIRVDFLAVEDVRPQHNPSEPMVALAA